MALTLVNIDHTVKLLFLLLSNVVTNSKTPTNLIQVLFITIITTKGKLIVEHTPQSTFATSRSTSNSIFICLNTMSQCVRRVTLWGCCGFVCGSILTIYSHFILVLSPQLSMSITIYFYSMLGNISSLYAVVVVVILEFACLDARVKLFCGDSVHAVLLFNVHSMPRYIHFIKA